MSGGYVIGLVLLSMAWLFFVAGAALNFRVWRLSLKAKEGHRVPSGIPFLPGVVGSIAAFLTLPLLAKHAQLELPWPWFWILLPLFLDVYCLGGIVLSLLGPTHGTKDDGFP